MDEVSATASARRPIYSALKPKPGSEADLEAFHARMGLGKPLTPLLTAERRAELARMATERIARDYARYGLEPVYADKERTIPLGLGTLLAMKWTLKVVGRNQFELLPPGKTKQ